MIPVTPSCQEFTSALLGAQASLRSDLVVRVYADGTPSPSGAYFLVDNIEIVPTNASQNASLVRVSATKEPES